MPKTYAQLLADANQIRTASQEGENTAERVGTFLTDCMEYVQAQDEANSTSIQSEATTRSAADTALTNLAKGMDDTAAWETTMKVINIPSSALLNDYMNNQLFDTSGVDYCGLWRINYSDTGTSLLLFQTGIMRRYGSELACRAQYVIGGCITNANAVNKSANGTVWSEQGLSKGISWSNDALRIYERHIRYDAQGARTALTDWMALQAAQLSLSGTTLRILDSNNSIISSVSLSSFARATDLAAEISRAQAAEQAESSQRGIADTNLSQRIDEALRRLNGTSDYSSAFYDPFLSLGSFKQETAEERWAAINASLDETMRQYGVNSQKVSGRMRFDNYGGNYEVFQFCRSSGTAESPPLYVQVCMGPLQVDENGLKSGSAFRIYVRQGYIDSLGELSLTMWKEFPDMDGYATRTDLQNMQADFNKHLDDRGSFASNTAMEADFAAAATDEPLVLFGKTSALGAICLSVPAPVGQYGGWRQLILEGNTFATRTVAKNQDGTRTAGSWTNK